MHLVCMKNETNKKELINNGFETEIVSDTTYGEYDVLILDFASLDDDGWQVRESYLSKAGQDNFIQVTIGDGINGWNIGEQCGYATIKRSMILCDHLGINMCALEDMMNEIDADEHLNSISFDILDRLNETK